MKKIRKPLPVVSAGSMADIAFLLLIFFLVATQISQDKGVSVILPEYYDGPVGKAIDRDVLNIKINKDDQLMVEGEIVEIKQLNKLIQSFVMNPDHRNDYPQSSDKAIISLQNDVSTSYETYVYVYSIIQSSYKTMRMDLAQSMFGKDILALDQNQMNTIKSKLPMKVSEADPFDM